MNKNLTYSIRAKDQSKAGFDSATRNARQFEGVMASSARAFNTFGVAAKAFAAGFTVDALISGVQRSVTSVLDLGKAAKTAGVSFRAFQELEYAAAANLVSVDALADGLKELQLRADEFIKTGGGAAEEAFGRLGLSATDLAEKLKQPDVLFEEVIDKLRTLDKAAQIRVADEIFGGTGGEQFVRFLDGAEKGIGDLRQEAVDLGAVMDDKLLAAAEDINAEWRKMEMIIGNKVYGAVIKVVDQMQVAIDNMRELENRSPATIGRTQLAQEEFLRNNPSAPFLDMDRAQAELGAMRQELARRAFGNMRVDDPARGDRLGFASDVDSVFADRFPAAPAEADPPARQRSTAAAREQRDAYQEVIEALSREREMIGLSELDQRILAEQRAAGVSATSEQGAAIAQLVTEMEREQQRLEALNREQEAFNASIEHLQSSAFEAFWQFTEGAEAGKEAVKGLASELVKAIAMAALFGQGPLAGLFGGGGGLLGGLFGGGGAVDPWAGLRLPGFAEGGSFRVGGSGGTDSQLVAFRASPDETVTISTPEQASAAAAGGMDVRITVDDEGRIAAAIDRKSRQAAGMAVRQAAPALIGASKAATFKDLASGKGDAMLRGRYGVKPVVSAKT